MPTIDILEEVVQMIKLTTLAGLGAIAIGASTKWTAALDSKDGSQVAGTATVEPFASGPGPMPVADSNSVRSVPAAPDSARALISLKGSAKGLHPWHIHAGTCGAIGSVVGTMANYPLITIGQDGWGTAQAVVAGLGSGDHVVAVHSGTSNTATIACGKLRPSPAP